MSKLEPRRGAIALVALAAFCSHAIGQDQPQAEQPQGDRAQVVIDRGLTEDIPYTAIYPNVFRSVDDGSPATILTLQHPDAPLQCDVFAVPGAEEGWSAEEALSKLDVKGIEATWIPDFPGFKIIAKTVAQFASGPALLYEGESDNSPLGVPLRIVHAQATGSGLTYAVECLMEKSISAEARPLVDFVIANFSTRSDGECCIAPDDRG